MNAVKPRIIWTGVQWMAFTRSAPTRSAPGHVFAVGFGPTPRVAYAAWACRTVAC